MDERTCTIAGCNKRLISRGFCKTHYNLWHRANRPATKTCLIDGCDGKHYGRGWCELHYDRWRKTGTTELPLARSCEVDVCDRPHFGRGFCRMHWERWSKHGDPHRIERGGHAHPTGERNPCWAGDRISYHGMHNRLRRLRGAPPVCVHCGTTAAEKYQWALNWDQVTEVRYGPVYKAEGRTEIMPYSVHPNDYIRLCMKCHRAFDLKHNAAAEPGHLLGWWPWERRRRK